MKAIYKYRLRIADAQYIEVHKDAQVMSAHLDPDEQLCVWALVDTDKPFVCRRFRIVGTGNPCEGLTEHWEFIGTVVTDSLVWHVFEDWTP